MMEVRSTALLVGCLILACGRHGPAGSTAGTGPISPAQRDAALQAVSAAMTALASQPPAAVNDGLLAALRSRAELQDVKLTASGNITARFTDGRWLILYRNFTVSSSTAARMPTEPAQQLAAPLSMDAAAATPAELPGSKEAMIFTALGGIGDRTIMGGGEAAPDLASQLNARGYHAVTPEASLDNLRKVSATKPGVFYIHAHGGTIPISNGVLNSDFALLTTTVASKDLEAADSDLRIELDSGLVGYAATPVDSKVSAWLSLDPTFKYAVTSAFAAQHWKLAPNALAVLNSCDSGGGGATVMAEALRANGASVYAGWTDEVDNTVGQVAARYLFDRLLGGNGFQPESPKQRPFDWPSTLADMQAKKLTHSSVPGADGKTHDADLFIGGDGKLGLLAPSIKRMLVDPPLPAGAPPTITLPQSTELTIQGLFGSQQGKVTIGGADAAVHAWTPTEVKVALAGKPGAGFDGDVVVSVNGIESNAVPLTSWEGTFVYSTYPLSPFPVLTATVTWHAWLRADVHSFRDKPAAAPQPPADPIVFRAAPATEVKWLDSGSVDLGGRIATLAGSETLPYGLRSQPAPYGDGYLFDGLMDVRAGKIDAQMSFLGCVGSYNVAGAQPVPIATIIASDVISGPTAAGTNSRVPFTLGADFTIAGGTRTSTLYPTAPPQLDWVAVLPQSPPDPAAGEDTKH